MITDIDALYFKWLMSRFEHPTVGIERVAGMLHENVFQRRVGNDSNRAISGAALRRVFLDDWSEADIDPRTTNDFLDRDCTWLEMLLAMCETLDYIYDGTVKGHFIGLISNLGLRTLLDRTGSRYRDIDQQLVDAATNRVDFNQFDANGQGGLFPLTGADHSDQREVEIWDQQAAYFSERLEGVMWTSTR